MRPPWYFWSFVIAGLVAVGFFSIAHFRPRDADILPPVEDLHAAEPAIRAYAMRRLAKDLTNDQLQERIDNDTDGDVRLLAAQEICSRHEHRRVAKLLGDKHEGISAAAGESDPPIRVVRCPAIPIHDARGLQASRQGRKGGPVG